MADLLLGRAAIKFRRLRRMDEHALAVLFRENDIPSVTKHFHPFALSQESARSLVALDGRDRYFGAFSSATCLGMSMLRGLDEGFEAPSLGILVHHAFTRRGIGSHLLDFTIAEAMREGCDRIRLTVYASNVGAHTLYLSRGFVEHESIRVVNVGVSDRRIVMFMDLRGSVSQGDEARR